MQRKNYLLMSPKSLVRNLFCKKRFTENRNNSSSTQVQMRPAMAMIMALTTLVILGTIMALSLSFTTETVKRTTDLYLHEQSILYSKSAAELALLDIAQNGSCTPSMNYSFDSGLYDANVTLRYVYKGLVCGGDLNYFTTINTDEQNGSVLMDITVTTDAGTEPIRYFRRSIQKL